MVNLYSLYHWDICELIDDIFFRKVKLEQLRVRTTKFLKCIENMKEPLLYITHEILS